MIYKIKITIFFVFIINLLNTQLQFIVRDNEKAIFLNLNRKNKIRLKNIDSVDNYYYFYINKKHNDFYFGNIFNYSSFFDSSIKNKNGWFDLNNLYIPFYNEKTLTLSKDEMEIELKTNYKFYKEPNYNSKYLEFNKKLFKDERPLILDVFCEDYIINKYGITEFKPKKITNVVGDLVDNFWYKIKFKIKNKIYILWLPPNYQCSSCF